MGGQERGRANDEDGGERYGLAESTSRDRTAAPLAPASTDDAGTAGGRPASRRQERKWAGKSEDERMMKMAGSDMGSPSRQVAIGRRRRSLRRPQTMPARPAEGQRADGKNANGRARARTSE